MPFMIRALIVDDEPNAREELQALLEETAAFEVVGACANAVEALKAIRRERPEVLFLDIKMPVIDGFELLSMIEEAAMPHVVFVTAYDEYALKAFEEKTLDYLLKPVDRDRLDRTVEKLRATLATAGPRAYANPSLERVPCLRGNRIKLVPVGEIELVRSDLTGVHVVSGEGEFFTELTLKVLEERADLVRCHKQYLLNLDRLDEITLLDSGLAEVRTRCGYTVPVSRRYLKTLRERLQL
jgi:two-component system LytT family response regulator